MVALTITIYFYYNNKYDSESWNVSRGNADMKIWFFIGHYNNFDTMTTEV